METSGAVLPCNTGLVVSARSTGRIREVEVGAGDCAFVAEKFGSWFVRDCEGDLCSGDISAADEDDRVAVGVNALSVMEREPQRTEVSNGLEEDGDDELGKLRFGFAKDI